MTSISFNKMNRTSKELKQMAKSALRGNYTIPILANIMINALTMAFSSLTTVLFPSSDMFSYVLSQIFSFIATVIFSLFTAGLAYMHLNISRGLPYSFSNLVYLFNRNPDRVLIVGFVLALINLITTIPVYILDQIFYTDQVINGDITAVMQYTYISLFALLFSLLLYTIVTIPLTLSYYLLVDNPEMPAKDAMKESIRLMRGNFWRYLKLQLSFIPLYLLSVFTCYIALLWIIPYLGMTETFFYRELAGDLPSEPYSPVPPVYGSTDSYTEYNDYNSEA